MALKMLALLVACLFLSSCCDAAIQTPISHEMIVDGGGKIHMSWVIIEDTITMEVTAETLGYVGIGFSPTGGMAGSDIVMFWANDDGQVVFKDMHATGRQPPVPDQSQDYELIGGKQNATHTLARFRRRMITCDTENDFPLGEDTVRLIWAYSDEDPQNEADLKWHGIDKRGTRSVYLISNDVKITEDIVKDYKTWDVRHKDVVLPSDMDTLYWCRIHKAPVLEKKHHVVGYAPIVTPGNEAYVHHIMLYECNHPDTDNAEVFNKFLEHEGAFCYSPNMPLEWDNCRPILAAWSVGGEGQLFPEYAGSPLTEKFGGYDYFMMEVHYDNPLKTAGIKDSSGMRVFYTDQLRKYDAGNINAGYAIGPFQIVPPGQKSFTTVGICSEACTEKVLPPEGINAFQVILHAHLVGRSIRLRHFRNGTELPPIAEDNHYDFNFQQARTIKPEVKILPGDTLVTECIYNTEENQLTTLGGLSTTEEMCMVILTYYPRVDLGICYSAYTPKTIADALGVTFKDPGPLDKYLSTPKDNFDSSVVPLVKLGGPLEPLDIHLLEYAVGGVEWTPEVSEKFLFRTTRDPHMQVCTGAGEEDHFKEKTQYIVNPSKEVGRYSKVYNNIKKPERCNAASSKSAPQGSYGWKSEYFRKISNRFN